MKPVTKIEKEVVALSSKLKGLTKNQILFYEKSFNNYYFRRKSICICTECNHKFNGYVSDLQESLDINIICPNCNKELERIDNNNKLVKLYYGIITKSNDWQVVRYFVVEKCLSKTEAPIYCHNEVMQHWINNKGQTVLMSLHVNGMSYYFDSWTYGTKMEIRKNYGGNRFDQRHNIIPYIIYPKHNVIPEIKRNGYKNEFHGCVPRHFFKNLLTDPKFETVLKAGYYELIRNVELKSYEKHWRQIKICIRNSYPLNEPHIWADYIELLRFLNKDDCNPKYVCPDDLHKAHERCLKKKKAITRKQKLEELKQQIKFDQIEYEKQKSKFFDISIKDNLIEVVPIKSVYDVFNESNELEHCAFENKYHKRDDSLLLSARINNERTETVEVSLKRLKVVQSYGFKNKITIYHDRIVNLVNNNINLIASKL